ncbi:hypothetical protein [uncultured Duncaniella sp.]|uniref:hypothetical protein n=1 Tax=uncultured Duncaniella sp. TaxID=2768039 RepID=UPI002657DA98|nr:hypothetical protein [uncultured Duncaniella sp.]
MHDLADNRRLTDASNLYHLCPGTPPQDSGVPGYDIIGVLPDTISPAATEPDYVM